MHDLAQAGPCMEGVVLLQARSTALTYSFPPVFDSRQRSSAGRRTECKVFSKTRTKGAAAPEEGAGAGGRGFLPPSGLREHRRKTAGKSPCRKVERCGAVRSKTATCLDIVMVRPEAFESGSVEGFAVVGMSYVDNSLGAFL